MPRGVAAVSRESAAIVRPCRRGTTRLRTAAVLGEHERDPTLDRRDGGIHVERGERAKDALVPDPRRVPAQIHNCTPTPRAPTETDSRRSDGAHP
jgi:hypothetical protein